MTSPPPIHPNANAIANRPKTRVATPIWSAASGHRLRPLDHQKGTASRAVAMTMMCGISRRLRSHTAAATSSDASAASNAQEIQSVMGTRH